MAMMVTKTMVVMRITTMIMCMMSKTNDDVNKHEKGDKMHENEDSLPSFSLNFTSLLKTDMKMRIVNLICMIISRCCSLLIYIH